MIHDDPLKRHSIEVLGLPKNILLLLDDQGITQLGDLEKRIDDGSLISLQDIGPVRAQNLTDAAVRYRNRTGKPQDFRRFLKKAFVSQFAVLLVVTFVLGVTVFDPVAKLLGLDGSTTFDHDEFKTLIFVAFSLIAFDVGRWAAVPSAYSSYLLSARRVRVIIACLATIVAMFASTKSLQYRSEEGVFFVTNESLRIFFLALVFVIIEGGRELFLSRRLRKNRTLSKLPSNPKEAPDLQSRKRNKFSHHIGGWYQRQSDPVRVAAVTVAGGVATTLITKLGEIFVKVISG